MLNDTGDLAGGNAQACKAVERGRGLIEGGIHGASPAHELCDGRCVLMVQAELFVQGIAAPLGTEIVGVAQTDGACQGDDVAVPPGVELLALSEFRRGQQLGQFVVEKLLHDGGGVLESGGSQQGLEPHRIDRLFASNPLPGNV